MAKDRRARQQGRKESGSFSLLPHAVQDSEDFVALSGGALKVLLGLLRQYKGSNNGDLSATHSQAKAWGIGSKTTLSKALEELQERALIICTRQGRFIKPGGCCALYAITWKAIDDCGGKLEVNATATPPRKFSLERAKNPVQKVYPQGTETVPTAA